MTIPFDIIEQGSSDFITITEEMRNRLQKYAELLVDWNQRMNLTAIIEPHDIAVKHFLDSLLLLKYLKIEEGASVIDVGTGAGFPGMVLKIARPDIKLTLLDSLNKRINFLNEVACELSLEVQTIHARAEDCDSVQLRESFDIATARAVAALPALCEYCLPYVKKGGVFVAMKGPSAGLEIQNANSAIKLLGGENAALYTENLPDGDERCFVFIKKVSQTSTKYPRKGIKIAKLPL